MNYDQEKQWRYAKGLELAILLKGTEIGPNENMVHASNVSDIIDEKYESIARNIAQRIKKMAAEMI